MKMEETVPKLQGFWLMLLYILCQSPLIITSLTIDVFLNVLILQLIEGYPPFHTKQENEVPKAYAAKQRPSFKAPTKHYAHGLKE